MLIASSLCIVLTVSTDAQSSKCKYLFMILVLVALSAATGAAINMSGGANWEEIFSERF